MDSLTVDHAAVDAAADQGPMEYVEESSTTRFINSASYSKTNKGEKWTDEETEQFYKVYTNMQWLKTRGVFFFKKKIDDLLSNTF
jgi:transcription factor TFIIIB component B''